jgi:cytochrome c biogenesis protein CcmG, thiol:disulfide interchange protein DsbE
MLKWLSILCTAASLLAAYERGDAVDPAILDRLEMRGEKIYVVDFFASWCGSCRKEIPLISRANSRIDTSRVEIIGVDVDKEVKAAERFQSELREDGALNFRVVNDPMNLLIEAFSPVGMPALYYVKSGTVVHVIYGAVDNIDDVILNDLETL